MPASVPRGYRAIPWNPALAGLRGVAVLLVFAFHAGLPVASGGPVGVTVFFVLSGYLITTILVRELTVSGSVSLRTFYVRRVRRLLPAFLVCAAAVAAVSASAGELERGLTEALLALSYVSNWVRASGEGLGMWNHAWSLAIEEQFYLAWPLAFGLLARRFHPTSWTFVAVVGAVAVTSVVVRIGLVAAGASDERIYFGSDTRADALLIGCALACAASSRRLPRVSTPLLGASLLVILALAALDTSEGIAFALGPTLVAATTGIVIVAAVQRGSGMPALGSSPLAWLGERSYSFYLWHVPVILSIGSLWSGMEPITRAVLLFGITVGLSMASYSLVEQPFRRPRTAAASDRQLATTVGIRTVRAPSA